ncbi:MarR family winged helix-turn-helix transcriptional regulator [Rugosimonospora africana]|uniref:HTH marR-type domain-containing protein n=1 Tax=Rugosimonospora africana TaxID=556532 RepID=A0A8J3VU75_9ACTN|nr:MarR family winged helix-turn-helix transcriptional regulator [Rugosimonospora africana]GIH18955.1 hypothetical protein Raf01_71270 [Rugosimonospora africana]
MNGATFGAPGVGAGAGTDQQRQADGPTTDLVRAANVVRVHLERAVLREFGLRWTGFDILQLVCHRRRVETRTVAAALGISKGTVTGISARLLALGLIRRHTQPADRRRVVLAPTAAGWELTHRIMRRVAAEENLMLRRTSPLPESGALAVLRCVADACPPAGPTPPT